MDSSPRIAEVRQDLLTELVPGSRAPVPPAERNQARTAGDRPDRRGGLLALAAAVVAAAVAAAVTAFTGTTTTPVTGPAVLVLDPESGALRDSAPLPLEPSAVHVGGDVIWVRSEVDSALAVLRVDGGSIRVQRVVGLVEPPTSLAVHDDEAIIGLSFSGKAVAVSSDRSSPPRPVSSALAGRLALDGDDDGVWAAAIDGALARLTGPPLRTPLPRIHGAPRALAVDGSHLWVAAFDSSELVRVHIHDGAQVASPLRGEPVGVSAANGQGWVVTASEDRLWRASDRGRVVGTSALPGLPVGVAAGTDRVWVAISRPAALAAYDPLTLELLLSVPLPREPVGVALDGERLVVALR